MPNLAGVLKEEIRRLARKEVKREVVNSRRAVSQHRRDIARLKKLIAQQDRKLARLASQSTDGASAAVDEDNNQRFSARSVRAQRRRLALSAQQYGQLAGVSGQTIYHWEMGKSRPRKAQFERLVAVRAIGRREALRRLSEIGTAKTRKTRRARRRPR